VGLGPPSAVLLRRAGVPVCPVHRWRSPGAGPPRLPCSALKLLRLSHLWCRFFREDHPAGWVRLGRPAGRHGCKSSSWPHPNDPAVPGWCGCLVQNQGGRQGREPVFLTFARADRHLLHRKVHILHPQAHGLQDAQPAAVEQLDDEFSSIEVGALGVDGVVVEPQDLTDLFE